MEKVVDLSLSYSIILHDLFVSMIEEIERKVVQGLIHVDQRNESSEQIGVDIAHETIDGNEIHLDIFLARKGRLDLSVFRFRNCDFDLGKRKFCLGWYGCRLDLHKGGRGINKDCIEFFQ